MNRATRTSIRLIVVAVALALAGAIPGTAAAAPGAAEDQYAEHIPDAGGERPSKTLDSGAGPGGGNGPGDPGAGVTRELSGLGVDGTAVRELVSRTAPEQGPGRVSPVGPNTGNGDGSFFGGASEAVTGASEGGMGLALPLLLVLIAILAVGGFVLSRRGRARGEA